MNFNVYSSNATINRTSVFLLSVKRFNNTTLFVLRQVFAGLHRNTSDDIFQMFMFEELLRSIRDDPVLIPNVSEH
jgi:hypothetical protein